MNEDDLIKRALQAYVFMTIALWLMSWAMQANGTANIFNPAWQLIAGLRTVFTAFAAIGLGGGFTLSLFTHIRSNFDARKSAALEAERRRRESLEAQQERLRSRERERIESQRQAQENQKREIEYRERLRKEQVLKQKRSTEDAAQSALDDF